MKRKVISLAQIPIKWRLTIWSAVFLFLVFVAYNTFQYFFIEKWMMRQEEQMIQQTMRDIVNYSLEKELSFKETELADIRGFLERINQKDQLIRILDEDGYPLLVVYDDYQNERLQSVPVTHYDHAVTEYANGNLVMVSGPITIFQFTGTVEIIKNMQSYEQLSDALFQVMAIGCLAAVVISGLGGRLLARQLLKPLQAMNETIRNIKQKGLQERVQFFDNQDEIASLMKMFNKMMDQVERSFKQQSQFVEDASHELRTPLAIIEGHLSLLRRWGKNDPAVLEESLQASIQELTRLKGLVQEMLVLARAEQERQEHDASLSDPDRVIGQMVRNIALLHPAFQLAVDVDALEGRSLIVSEEHLEQILLILLDNAVKYSGENKRVEISAVVSEESARISVSDRGVGIPKQDLPYVMDRLYRVDKSRSREQSGHGLGLSIAKRLVEKYGGTIMIHSSEGKGTTVSFVLPLKQESKMLAEEMFF
ncbi:HAMP domain-containing sensor histidine kinase [Brevibacillus reuszeri]|uniref:HAMP domain-containing sensor histidine kinase n=1 Tax=Brevibacillus reuszeri TaxID=54915 RepID=UPI0028997526|nr:HAMP domain-containing histidine kinase [Brevibacillus reuszeri]